MCRGVGWSPNGARTRRRWSGPIAGCARIACWPRPTSRSRSACSNETAEKRTSLADADRYRSNPSRFWLFRRDHHQHLAPLHARELLDLGALGGVVLHPLEHRHAELAMGELATA